MSVNTTSTQRSHNQVKIAEALPLPQWPVGSGLSPDQEHAAHQPSVKQTDLWVLLAWALVVIPIIWGFLQTLRYSLLLFQ